MASDCGGAARLALLVKAAILGMSCSGCGAYSVVDSAVVSNIAVGACNYQERAQPAWDAIVADEPDVFVWVGDAIYGDRQVAPGLRAPDTIDVMRAKYAQQKANPGYQGLLRSVPKVYGVWDDHDYGQNNGNANYLDREPSQELFINFIGDAKDSVRRTRPGTYDAYSFGPAGKRVTLILLDVRYFKDETEGALLGEAQWEWFESVLRERADSQLFLIASGIQVLAPDRVIAETWVHYPEERQRMLGLLRDLQLPGVPVLLSGDVHFAELSCMEAGLEAPLLELTTSGLNLAWGEVGPYAFVPGPFGLLARLIMASLPGRYQLDSIDHQHNISKVHGSNYLTRLNFGSVRIDWEAGTVDLGARNAHDGALAFNHTFSLNKSKFHGEFVVCAQSSPVLERASAWMARGVVLFFFFIIVMDCGLVLWLVNQGLRGALCGDDSDDKKQR